MATVHVECGTDIVVMLRNHRRRGSKKAHKLKSTLPNYGPTSSNGIATKEQLLNSKHAFSGRKDGSILMAPSDWVIYPFDRCEVVSSDGEGGICYNEGELVFAIARCKVRDHIPWRTVHETINFDISAVSLASLLQVWRMASNKK
jgi:hypothetical protein